LLVALLLVGCGSSSPEPVPEQSSPRPSWLAEAERIERPPVRRPLRELLGIASNPQDLPLGNDDEARALRQGYWDAALELGGAMVRRDFRWEEIEPSDGQFEFAAYDQLVDEAESHGVRLLGTLDYGTKWASSEGSSVAPPDNPADYADYAARVAERYAGRMLGWEIWNEPNNPFFWSADQREAPARYAPLLARASEAIRAVDPGATVVLGGTTFTPAPPILQLGAMDFLSQAFAAAPDLAASYDVAAIHTYMAYPPHDPPEHGENLDPPLRAKIEMHAWLQQLHGAADRPLWITEMGWPTYARVSAQEQADYTARGTILAARYGAEAIFWYTLRNGEEIGDIVPEGGFGLREYAPAGADGSAPKPAFVALQTLLTVVGERWASSDDPQLEGMPADGYAVRFSGPGGADVLALWTIETNAMVQLPAAAELIDQQGEHRGSSDQVAIGPSVTYALL
jgi:hypothetical protein